MSEVLRSVLFLLKIVKWTSVIKSIVFNKFPSYPLAVCTIGKLSCCPLGQLFTFNDDKLVLHKKEGPFL